MSDFLSAGEFAAELGCTVQRLRLLLRAGLLHPWGDRMDLVPVIVDAHHAHIVVASPDGLQALMFHRNLLAEPSLYVLALNKINPAAFGPGWTGPRDNRTSIKGIVDARIVEVVPPMKRPSKVLNQFGRLARRTRTGTPA
jgi:hypothetical protein